MNEIGIQQAVSKYYSEKLQEFGAVAKGVDWNDKASQNLRLEKLLSLWQPDDKPSLLDVGCGYGALLDYLVENKSSYSEIHSYQGCDLSSEMISKALLTHSQTKNSHFFTVSGQDPLPKADYVVASGIFNVKLETSIEDWQEYMKQMLIRMFQAAKRTIAFNVLTCYVDDDYRRDDLYYAPPGYWLDFCCKNFSRHITLLQDYGLYEFTLIVRRFPITG
ncbi:class I SAM-dependent methyltransferase [Magnetococcales bacterium HHB-1]